MSMPKFKPTKWKLRHCAECKSSYYWACKNKGHTLVERDNVPFFIEHMIVSYFGGKWSTLASEKPKRTYRISRSNFGPLVTKCGIEPGGHIRNQWWMWCKVGSSTSLKWLPKDE
jgi:hypothetical protein